MTVDDRIVEIRQHRAGPVPFVAALDEMIFESTPPNRWCCWSNPVLSSISRVNREGFLRPTAHRAGKSNGAQFRGQVPQELWHTRGEAPPRTILFGVVRAGRAACGCCCRDITRGSRQSSESVSYRQRLLGVDPAARTSSGSAYRVSWPCCGRRRRHGQGGHESWRSNRPSRPRVMPKRCCSSPGGAGHHVLRHANDSAFDSRCCGFGELATGRRSRRDARRA